MIYLGRANDHHHSLRSLTKLRFIDIMGKKERIAVELWSEENLKIVFYFTHKGEKARRAPLFLAELSKAQKNMK